MIEVRQIALARSLQILKSPAGTIGYLPDLVNQLKARYNFVQAPKTEDLLPSDPPKGAEFRHGRLPNDPKVIIDKLTVFNDGVVADAAESTDHADEFLSDFQEWAKTAIPKAMPSGPRFYLSQLEIKMEPPLEAYVQSLKPIGEKITQRLATYGIQTTRYEVSAINMNWDVSGKPVPQAGQFFIDRRLNVPYSENVWFTQAPLRTADHIALLKELAV